MMHQCIAYVIYYVHLPPPSASVLYPTHLQPAGQQGHQAIRVVTIRNGEDPTTLGMAVDVDESQELSFPALCLATKLLRSRSHLRHNFAKMPEELHEDLSFLLPHHRGDA